MQFGRNYCHFAVVKQFVISSLILFTIRAFSHYFRKVFYKFLRIYSLLFATFEYMLQTACIIAPDEVYIPYIFAMKCAFNMPLLFSEQFVDGILSFYVFLFLT